MPIKRTKFIKHSNTSRHGHTKSIPRAWRTSKELKGSRSGVPQKKEEEIPDRLVRAIKQLAKSANEWGIAIDFEPGYIEQVEILQGSEHAIRHDAGDKEVVMHTHPGSSSFADLPSEADVQVFTLDTLQGVQQWLIVTNRGKVLKMSISDEALFNVFAASSSDTQDKELEFLMEKAMEDAKITMIRKDYNDVQQKMYKERLIARYWKKYLKKNIGVSFKQVNMKDLKTLPRSEHEAIAERLRNMKHYRQAIDLSRKSLEEIQNDITHRQHEIEKLKKQGNDPSTWETHEYVLEHDLKREKELEARIEESPTLLGKLLHPEG